MADAPDRKLDERVKLRDLPPVAPVDWPARLSMTLARHLNRCPRAGYLYVATGGAAPTAEMDRGTLAHAGLARMVVEWMTQGEDRYAGAGDDQLSSMTAEVVRDVGRELPELWVPHEQRDIARVCVFHAAIGLDVDPANVVGVERKFILELPGSGWTVSGIIDLASMPDDESAWVDDYKTALAVPPKNEWDFFQQKLYAAMVMFGRPLDREPCPNGCVLPPAGEGEECLLCKSRGYVEVPGKPIGGHLRYVRGRELYPRHDPRRRADGKLARLEEDWSRLELMELVQDMDDLGDRLSEMLESWKFPARYGTKACNECPAEALCPIPRGYRRFAGHVQTEDQAREAWSWAQRQKALVGITEKEVKEFAAVRAVSLPIGDEVWSYELTETKQLKKKAGRADWEGLEAAVTAAAEEGAEFDLREWVKVSNVSSFKKAKKPKEGATDGDGRAAGGPAAGGFARARRDRGDGDAGGGERGGGGAADGGGGADGGVRGRAAGGAGVDGGDGAGDVQDERAAGAGSAGKSGRLGQRHGAGAGRDDSDAGRDERFGEEAPY